MAVVGKSLALSSIVRAMVNTKRNWSAMISFCEAVIALNKTAKRVRESSVNAVSFDRRRPGG